MSRFFFVMSLLWVGIQPIYSTEREHQEISVPMPHDQEESGLLKLFHDSETRYEVISYWNENMMIAECAGIYCSLSFLIYGACIQDKLVIYKGMEAFFSLLGVHVVHGIIALKFGRA